MEQKVSNLMKIIIHILKHTDDLNHDFPVGERRVSLATPPHVADIIRLQLNDDAVLFKIESIQHHLTMQNSVGTDMDAETHVYLQTIPQSGMAYNTVNSYRLDK